MFRNISINLLIILSFSFSQEFYDVKERYRNGNPKKVVKYDLTGLFLEKTDQYYFYENGQKWKVLTYKDGKYHGLHIEWYEHGQMSWKRPWKDGKENGLWTRWYDHGQKSFEQKYKDGELISEKLWNEDGSVIE